ncbi:hypothetical protein HCJ02_01615 [Listeria seeligeri]|uniref:hypothetical protein n=1 Tax=Listeria TaxID=1637 RepID=UPI001629E17F|nr:MULTISPECIES: hypothetical protein [Listeria]MBC1532031.1 hypothetical protein [Listeria seeligeri]MBC1827156.1 hypothetical protein [Listeria seeligeri]MBC1840052.1 hypothetical protein [Listeria seeligeri]MBC6141944.1 hypothetical protein [Listeria seeligeri]MBC6302433.1 hypothetical protein [Listeria immobilis]
MMKSPWIPVFYDKKENKNYFYNVNEKKFVEGKYSAQNTIVTLLSGTVGVVLYALLGSFIIKMPTNYLTGLSILLGIIISVLLIIVIDHFSKKSDFGTPISIEKVSFCFEEGEKQFKKNLRIGYLTFLLAIGSTVVLYFSNGEAILFFATALFWMLPLPLFVLQRPFKRKKMYALYKKNQLPIENGGF